MFTNDGYELIMGDDYYCATVNGVLKFTYNDNVWIRQEMLAIKTDDDIIIVNQEGCYKDLETLKLEVVPQLLEALVEAQTTVSTLWEVLENVKNFKD